MKKILILNLTVLLFASAAFAGGTIDLDLTKTGLTVYGSKTDAKTAGVAQKQIGKCSTGVGVGIISDANGYALWAQHKNGIKAYGSSHDSTAIFMTDVTAGKEIGKQPSKIGSDDFVKSGTVWSSM